ncbi:TPA: hypothetical protein QHU17_004552 [Enterobacter hormaechei subsp. xiangfangensis]|uniref:hypothetical protein n=1 Tax=Enterobacter mori TaxID=539813 RepID=UPI00277CEE6C|nr:hypothetical protein [Enterobacter mori]HDS5593100.1 hypothetical protein [Enterobacter hormaechei subsp. xiangfangensis]
MNTRPGISQEPLPQGPSDICERAWHDAIQGTAGLTSARDIAEHWLNKGGDIHWRAARFLIRESLYVAGLSASTAICGRMPFALLVRQLRLLAVMQYLGGQDLRQGATQYRALEALYGTAAVERVARWHRRSVCNVVEDYRRTYRAARLFHRQYVAPVFPPLAPLR